jgi:hypothetical protein
MWKPLTSAQTVHPGDKIRYVGVQSLMNTDTYFKVIKTDSHYFEILPDPQSANIPPDELSRKKIVKYFDIGHNIVLEVWNE